MATDEPNKEATEETTEGAEPQAGVEETDAVQEPATDEAAAEQAAPREKKPRSRRHVPRSQRRRRAPRKREASATRKPIVRGTRAEHERGRRQERRGIVVSDKGDKTIVVKVDVIKLHPRYKKVVRRSVKFHAHDERNEAGLGDTVRIVETRPLSKTKNWRLAEVVEKAR
jgi:small subunit ribosomal protein S17